LQYVDSIDISKRGKHDSIRHIYNEASSVDLKVYDDLLKLRLNHWPDIDEDLSTEGLLRGAPAPISQAKRNEV